VIKFSILVIGTEITQGYSRDTNSSVLARILTGRGFAGHSIIKAPDSIDVISRSIAYLRRESNILILTGGLGSTHDDVTREALSRALGRDLELRDELKTRMERLLPRGADEEMFFKQAYLPAGAEAILPEQGSAPGIIVDGDGCLIFALPGVPREMTSMMGAVIKRIETKFPEQPPQEQRVIKIFGAGEPLVAKKIDAVIKDYSELGFTILAGIEEIKIIISAFAADDSYMTNQLERAKNRITESLGELVFGFDDITLEQAVGSELKRRDIKLFTAESCTGGLLSQKITSVPGSSEYFLGGVVSYDNQIKAALLNVSQAALERYGAVSKEVATEMAAGARAVSRADLALSITGIAGPGGGTPDKPVGLVFMAISDNSVTETQRFDFRGGRDAVRRKAAQSALNIIRLYLKKLR